MRHAFACLLAAGLSLGATFAEASDRRGAFHGPGLHHRPLVHAPASLRGYRGPGVLPHRLGDRHRHGRRGYGYPFAFGYPYGDLPRAYGNVPQVVETAPERRVDEITITPGVPTVAGIRPAPVGRPTLYVLNDPAMVHSRMVAARPGARGAEMGDEDGPRVIHLRVPRDRPRWR